MPFAAAAQSVNERAERAFRDWGAALGRGLGDRVALAPRESDRAPVPDDFPVPADEPDALSGPPLAGDKPPSRRPKKGQNSARAPELSVYVDERRLTEIARRHTIPAARPVPATAARPAGIALFGVGGFGVGLRDGDVLTAVEGRPVQAEGQVVGVVMAMLARHERRITGEFWRGGRRGSIVVDVPVVELLPLNER